jgi:hypothetical protein
MWAGSVKAVAGFEKIPSIPDLSAISPSTPQKRECNTVFSHHPPTLDLFDEQQTYRG